MSNKPKYPITVLFIEEAEIETFSSELGLITYLEWFDSSAPEWKVKVQDVTGAPVNLKIEALEIVQFEYKQTPNEVLNSRQS